MTGDDGPHTFQTSTFFCARFYDFFYQEKRPRHISFYNANLIILIPPCLGGFIIESAFIGLLCDRTDMAQPPGPKPRCGDVDYNIHFCQLEYAAYTLFQLAGCPAIIQLASSL